MLMVYGRDRPGEPIPPFFISCRQALPGHAPDYQNEGEIQERRGGRNNVRHFARDLPQPRLESPQPEEMITDQNEDEREDRV